jgi:hypothetical protein
MPRTLGPDSNQRNHPAQSSMVKSRTRESQLSTRLYRLSSAQAPKKVTKQPVTLWSTQRPHPSWWFPTDQHLLLFIHHVYRDHHARSHNFPTTSPNGNPPPLSINPPSNSATSHYHRYIAMFRCPPRASTCHPAPRRFISRARCDAAEPMIRPHKAERA